MSLLLSRLQRYLRQTDRARQFLRPRQYEEQQGFADNPKQGDAELLEHPFRAIPVGEPEPSPFTHFLDGIQRSWLLYYVEGVPVYYGYTAAVIRARTDRVLSTWQHRQQEALYLPTRLCSESQALKEIPIIDTLGETTVVPPDLTKIARDKISSDRQQLETQLAATWMQQNCPGWLVIDGSIRATGAIASHDRVIGIIKTHNTQFFSWQEQQIIQNLKAGERSSTFCLLILFDQNSPPRSVCSWYLRLREGSGDDIHFGLVRIEISPTCQATPDQISRWLLDETRPLALPDTRWDRMIYPIRDCEMYLRSQEPHPANFGWLF
ncbi:MAG: hypothetical protein RMK91_10490 [Pseudanabaenaceae cyanobacterium SKYGB_i_bin29]|nr:hypothetical protein [Pseudanabaenaceae cyanobacterium SKYG29]MDW8422280.1 hypothetical protein [Pseudanabaenaceae cyanobacterium SKYGB_i_bin29]